MLKDRLLKTFCFAASGMALFFFPSDSDALSFSPPERLVTIPWSNGVNHGAPAAGVEWLVVDSRGRYWLEVDLDFNLYAPNGRYLQTVSPIDKLMNFFGFAAMEAMPNGGIVLLQRLETPAEEWGKDNFEVASQPGARLILLNADGTVEIQKEELDPLQPHSDYDLESGSVYSTHDDGTFTLLESFGPPSKDGAFGKFAAFGYDVRRWHAHLKTLPIFRYTGRDYHAADGNIYEDPTAQSFLMGRPFIEGTAPLAEKNGKIYYQVVLYPNGQFVNAVFVEDSVHKLYALVDLIPADPALDTTHDHALFADQKGNLFEGVAEKEGYRIYEWKILP
jgi:hypothetical protein